MWYANRKCQDRGQDLSLDFDVQSGYGPETISVNRAIAGEYRFYVNKYAGSGSIEESEAKVQERHVMLTVDHRVDSIDSALLSLRAHMPDSRTRQRTAAAAESAEYFNCGTFRSGAALGRSCTRSWTGS